MQTKVEAICKGTDAIQRFAEKHVIPILQGLVSRSDYEEALISVYYRMYTWLLSLVKLRNPIHIQAASAAARSTFELLLDLKALYNDPKLEAKYHAFTFVERFHAARTLINYIDSTSGATGSYKMERDFISDASNIAKFNSLLTTHWPAKPGKKQGTPSHWTGKDVAGLRTRCRSEVRRTLQENLRPPELVRASRASWSRRVIIRRSRGWIRMGSWTNPRVLL